MNSANIFLVRAAVKRAHQRRSSHGAERILVSRHREPTEKRNATKPSLESDDGQVLGNCGDALAVDRHGAHRICRDAAICPSSGSASGAANQYASLRSGIEAVFRADACRLEDRMGLAVRQGGPARAYAELQRRTWEISDCRQRRSA